MLKIEKVDLHLIEVRRNTGFPSQHVIVELTTDHGIGWGEIDDLGHLPLYQFDLDLLGRTLNDLLAGRDAENRLAIESAMAREFTDEGHMYSRSGLVRQGVDLAVIDAVGRHHGLAATTLLGGARRDYLEVCYPLFRGAPGDALDGHLETVAAKSIEGFGLFRLYTGGDLAAERAFLEASNPLSGVPDQVIRLLEPADLAGVSALDRGARGGVRTGAGRERHPARRLRRHAGVRETESVAAFGARRVDDACLATRPPWCGRHPQRLTVCPRRHHPGEIRVAEFAAVAGVGVLIGTTQEMGIGTAAAAIVGAVAPTIDHPCDNVGPRLYVEDILTTPMRYSDGRLMVPEGPGLGVDVDRARVQALGNGVRLGAGL